jgi:hypothetical protein
MLQAVSKTLQDFINGTVDVYRQMKWRIPGFARRPPMPR